MRIKKKQISQSIRIVPGSIKRLAANVLLVFDLPKVRKEYGISARFNKINIMYIGSKLRIQLDIDADIGNDKLEKLLEEQWFRKNCSAG